jgi:hypothetical protein
MTTYLKKTYLNNPYRPNTGAFKDRSYTEAVVIGNKLKATELVKNYGLEKCSEDEYQKIIKENADFENSITKPADDYKSFKPKRK